MRQSATRSVCSTLQGLGRLIEREDTLPRVPVPLEIRTDRLCLRRLTAAHLPDLVELDSDPEVMRFISGGEPSSRQRYESELLPRMLAWDAEPYGFLAAYEADAFVGWFHLRPTVAPGETMLELGYRLRRAAWGRGLATEGGRALVRYAFEELDHAADLGIHDSGDTALAADGRNVVVGGRERLVRPSYAPAFLGELRKRVKRALVHEIAIDVDQRLVLALDHDVLIPDLFEKAAR